MAAKPGRILYGYYLLAVLVVLAFAFFGVDQLLHGDILRAVIGLTLAVVTCVSAVGITISWKRSLKSFDLMGYEKEDVEKKIIERTREMKKYQARLESSIDSLPIGFLIMDNEHNVIVANPALYKILEVETNSHSEEFLQKLLQGGKLDIKDICRACKLSTGVETFMNIRYHEKYLKLITAPVVIFPEGRISGTVVLVEDKTESVSLDRAKDEFISIVSHEMRTPLTVMEGNINLLVDHYKGLMKDKAGASDAVFDEMLSDLQEASSNIA